MSRTFHGCWQDVRPEGRPETPQGTAVESLWPPPAQDGAKGYGKRAERDVRATGRHQSGRVWILNRVVRRGPGDQVTFM